MPSSNSRLSLEDLAARLDVLELENQSLHARLAAYEDPIGANVDGSVPATMERLSRRWVLRRGMQVAAASVAAGVIAQHTAPSASADTFGYVSTKKADVVNDTNQMALQAWTNADSAPAFLSTNIGEGPAVQAISHEGNGVEGTSFDNGYFGVRGVSEGNVGVWGKGLVGIRGVTSTDNYVAIHGISEADIGYGVSGEAAGEGVGVTGTSPEGAGVRGVGADGVVGESTTQSRFGVKGTGGVGVGGYSSEYGYEGVYGQHTGSYGFGVAGVGTGSSGAGVLGRNSSGEGARGEGKVGVYAKSTNSTVGYGLVAAGGRAQMRLLPGSSAGKPTTGSHQKGELYMDSAGALFVCTVPGTPGTWRKFTTAPA